MKLITPSEALEKLILFCDRVDRIESNNYTNKRFHTYDIRKLESDIRKLESEIKKIVLCCSIGIHNKNKERADLIIDRANKYYKINNNPQN